MFREMRRFRQQISHEECLGLLAKEKRAVLAVNGEDGYPYGVPVDYYLDRETETIWIHSARQGHKLDSIKKDPRVCLTVYNQGTIKEGDWAYDVTSVIIFGKAEVYQDDPHAFEMLKNLGSKYYPDEQEMLAEFEKDHKRVCMIAITIDHMTGKLVNEK